MASHLCRTRALLQIPRYAPTLIARTQATQTTPTAGKGIPTPGNFDSAIPPPPPTTGSKSTPPFGDPHTNQSFMNTPASKAGAVVVLSIAIYAGYKLISGNKEHPKDKKDSKDQKDQKDSKDPKDPKDSKDPKDPKDSKDQKDPKDSKDKAKK